MQDVYKNRVAETDVSETKEYTDSAVPKSQRKNFGQLVFVWIGYVFTVTIMTAGGNIALGSANITQALKAVGIAFLFLVVLGSAVAVMTVAIGICAPFMIIIGMVGMMVYGESDIAYILKAQGLIAPAWFALVVNVWSTAQGNVYSSSLNLSSIFTKIPREKLVIIFGGLGTIMGLLGIYRYFGDWLSFLASIFPAVGGVIIADYFFTYKEGYYSINSVKLPKYIWLSYISVAGGILSNFFLNFGLSAINSLITSFIIQAIFSILFIRKEIKNLNEDISVEAPIV